MSFREWLAVEGNQREVDRSTLDDNTVRRRIGICRQIFNFAVDSEWLTRNPFKGLAATVHANPERFFYIDRKLFARVIDRAPDAEWRAIIALNRLIAVLPEWSAKKSADQFADQIRNRAVTLSKHQSRKTRKIRSPMMASDLKKPPINGRYRIRICDLYDVNAEFSPSFNPEFYEENHVLLS